MQQDMQSNRGGRRGQRSCRPSLGKLAPPGDGADPKCSPGAGMLLTQERSTLGFKMTSKQNVNSNRVRIPWWEPRSGRWLFNAGSLATQVHTEGHFSVYLEGTEKKLISGLEVPSVVGKTAFK